MNRTHSSLRAVFDAYGDDAEAGLQALANTDPPFWHEFTEAAATKQYQSELGKYRRTLVVSVVKERVASDGGQVRLFEPAEVGSSVLMREVVRLDGQDFRTVELAGREGAGTLRRIAARDLAPAQTTLARCKDQFALADHIEAETERLGRDVSVGEAIQIGRAA